MNTGISLGFDCHSATYSVNNGIRDIRENGYKTCPFDMCVTPYKGLIECIKDDFKYFLDDNYLELRENTLTDIDIKRGEKLVYNKKYKIIFNHESPYHVRSEKWIDGEYHYIHDNMKLFKERYSRRIDNFKNYIKCENNNITFVIDRFNKDISELDKVIKSVYNINFRIICIDPNQSRESVKKIYKLCGLTDEEINEEIK